MKITICFTGGGTAGHVYPGLSVLEMAAEKCIKNGTEHDFFWIGSSSGMEKRLLEEENIRYYGISTGKFRRYFSLRNFTDIFRISGGLLQSFRILLKEKPDLVFSKGGYVSVPPVIAAFIMRIPVITHESDYTPGLATRINSCFSKYIMLSLDDTKKYFKKRFYDKLLVTGNPVRKIFFNGSSEAGRKFLGITNDKPVLLVLGGSQGAREINTLIHELSEKLSSDFNIIHQCGDLDYNPDEVNGVSDYYQVPFFRSELSDVIAAADIVISRGGAGTIWELSAAGKASILIPLRGSGTRGDQVKNSRYLVSLEAADMLCDKVITGEMLYKKIVSLMNNMEMLEKYRKNIKNISSGDPSDIISEKILETAGGRL